MKHNPLPVLLLFLFSIPAQAQVYLGSKQTERKAEHRLNLSYSPKLYLNSIGVKGDNKFGIQPLSATNNFGYQWDAEYQRTSRSGFIFSIGPNIGGVRHNVGFNYNLAYVDRDVKEFELYNIDTSFSAKVTYLGLRVMAGYRWKSPFKAQPNWDLDLKGGVSCWNHTHFSQYPVYNSVAYMKNDTLFLKRISFDYVSFGTSQPLGSEMTYALHAYIGLSGNTNWPILKNITLGIEAIYGGRSCVGASSTLYSYDSSDNFDVSGGSYDDKGLGIGIRLGVGLWPK